jgi:alanyl-tRNA synthetase
MICSVCNRKGNHQCEYCKANTSLCSCCYDKLHECKYKPVNVVNDKNAEIKIEPDYTRQIEVIQDNFAIEMLQARNNELSQQLEQLDEMYEKIKSNYEDQVKSLTTEIIELKKKIAELQEKDEERKREEVVKAVIDENISKIKTIKKKVKKLAATAASEEKLNRLSSGKSTVAKERADNIA